MKKTIGVNINSGNSFSISVVIPTLNAELEIESLLESLLAQTRVPDEIIVIDSASEDSTIDIVRKYPEVKLIQIDRRDFNHGLTRDRALGESFGEIVCFLTQDALPANDLYIENLIRPILEDSRIAISSGRQLPKEDARRFEQLVREFNYPRESAIRSSIDVPKLGIKAYFATDVCSAYRRTAYFECGGFEKTDISEDMYIAAKAINSGWKVAYAADAEVFHSHNLTFKQQFNRNRAIGSFLQSNSDVLHCDSEVGEGGRLVRNVSKQLIRERNLSELLAFSADCIARLLGNRIGRMDGKKVAR